MTERILSFSCVAASLSSLAFFILLTNSIENCTCLALRNITDAFSRRLILGADDIQLNASAQSHLNVHSSSSWMVNYPTVFHNRSSKTGELVDNRRDLAAMRNFHIFADSYMLEDDGSTDGEALDVIEHFFWGQTGGVAMELGALDGSPATYSMTFDLEQNFSWTRILVEGNPKYREDMILKSPNALSVNAAVCEKQSKVHYQTKDYVGGIVEFMDTNFLRDHHPSIYKACTPPGNISSLTNLIWSRFPAVLLLDCIPLSHVFAELKLRHINYFILDVEGGEMEVLRSINWALIKFDVLCIETDPANRSKSYPQIVTAFMDAHGYIDYSGQQGRNIWFIRKDFVPHKRPARGVTCFNGASKSVNAHQKSEDPLNTPDWQPCPSAPLLTISSPH